MSAPPLASCLLTDIFFINAFKRRCLDCHNNDNNDRLVHRCLLGRDAERIQGGGDRLDGVRTDNRACQPELSAAEAVAAECNCQNRIQLEVQSDVVGIRRADPGGSNNAGNSCTQSADNIAQENDALGIDARDAGSLLIDADALDI